MFMRLLVIAVAVAAGTRLDKTSVVAHPLVSHAFGHLVIPVLLGIAVVVGIVFEGHHRFHWWDITGGISDLISAVLGGGLIIRTLVIAAIGGTVIAFRSSWSQVVAVTTPALPAAILVASALAATIAGIVLAFYQNTPRITHVHY